MTPSIATLPTLSTWWICSSTCQHFGSSQLIYWVYKFLEEKHKECSHHSQRWCFGLKYLTGVSYLDLLLSSSSWSQKPSMTSVTSSSSSLSLSSCSVPPCTSCSWIVTRTMPSSRKLWEAVGYWTPYTTSTCFPWESSRSITSILVHKLCYATSSSFVPHSSPRLHSWTCL